MSIEMVHKPLILVVEDEAHIANVISLVLEEEGYRVVWAEDGVEGLRLARSERPGLIISDLMMPRLDGAEFIARLRSDPALRATPILAISCRLPTRHELDVDRFLPKPFEIDDLVRHTRSLCPVTPEYAAWQDDSAPSVREAEG